MKELLKKFILLIGKDDEHALWFLWTSLVAACWINFLFINVPTVGWAAWGGSGSTVKVIERATAVSTLLVTVITIAALVVIKEIPTWIWPHKWIVSFADYLKEQDRIVHIE